jgi:beta-lactam-binding protein with PASTA domain
MSRTLSRQIRPLARRAGAAGLLALAVAGVTAAAAPSTASASAGAMPAGHSRPHVIHSSGRGHAAAARVVSFRKLARAWQARHRTRTGQSAPPSGGRISPDAAFTTAFHGISQAQCAGCVVAPVAATSADGAQIVESNDAFMAVFDKNGTTLCGGGITLDAFLGATGLGPQTSAPVQYDDVSNQFILAAASPGSNVAYIAATTGHDACGSWNIYRVPQASSAIGVLTAGQDARALLLSVQVGLGFELAALPKADLYAGRSLTFAQFPVNDVAVPVTTAGSPLIDTPDSYFLSVGPTLGPSAYVLYTMAGSGTPAITLTSQRLASAPDAPAASRVPPTAPPIFDGSRIWFAHEVGFGEVGESFVRYGYINVADASVTSARVDGIAGASAINPSIAVIPGSGGTVSVFLDWLSRSVTSPNPVSDLVKSFVYPGGPLPGNAGLDQNVASSDTDGIGPGEVSSAAADPGTATGSCAVTAQAAFLSDSTWTTLIRRKCGPAGPVEMPSVIGDSRAAGISAVQAAGFAAAVTDFTTPGVSCNASTAGTIFDQDPLPSLVSSGVTAHLAYCDLTTATVPDVIGSTPDQAAAALRAAGLTLGSVIGTSQCSPASSGLILAASPAIGTRQVTGTAINLQQCVNPLTTVPDVTGDTPDQAAAAIRSAGLVVGSTSLTTSCEVRVGTIVRTSPPAGDRVTAGTTVNLVKSKGRSGTCD